MHRLQALVFAIFLVTGLGLASESSAQTTCTGLCLQQTTCPAGQTTSISGTVYTPNGSDPLPNVQVYVPNAPVAAFTPGVSCPVSGEPPSGSPLVGTMSAPDGTYTITDMPVGANIPLVIQSGRWRRQLVIPNVASCANTSFSARMPRNQTEGDIPKIAVATGRADQVECVLRKVGVDDSEFTNPSGTGRVNLFLGSGSKGAQIDASTPSQNVLMGDPATLNAYDVLMVPCQGAQYNQSGTELANFMQFANAGGRVYSSHFSYVWMYKNPPFDGVVHWNVGQAFLPDGIATVDQTFAEGQTLAQWLQVVGASTTPGQIAINTLKHDLDGVVAPTQSWLTLNDPGRNNPVMQFVFDTPVTASNKCGRVLFNEYHVENPSASPAGQNFPSECPNQPMNAQEKLLEFSLFELTADGGQASLIPTVQDFGSEPLNFSTAPQTFVWTNNSTFPASVSLAAATGDFAIASNTCTSLVQNGGSCQIGVVFKPTVIGARTGMLTVGSNGSTLTATLKGNGIPDFSISNATLDFGNLDVTASRTLPVTLTNNAPGAVPLSSLATSGDFAVSSNCGLTVPALASCTLNVTFTPSTTGPRTGGLNLNGGSGTPSLLTQLSGNGVDFAISDNPTSGSLIAGYTTLISTLTSPIAGFAANVSLSCTTTAAASTCTPSATSFVPSSPITTTVNITTTAQYTVIGYGGSGGGSGVLALLAVSTGFLVWMRRRGTPGFAGGRTILLSALLAILAGGSLYLTGCSGKSPAMNAQYTAAGNYTYTLIATDGTLTHTATYALKVTAK